MSLRLIWAGPWNERSAIALFGTRVVAELISLGHHVEVIRTEVGADLSLPVRPAPCEIHEVDPSSLHNRLRGADSVILNLGNHYGFHGGVMPILRDTPGVVILHDAWMGDFVQGWRQAVGPDAWRVDRMFSGLHADPSAISTLCSLATGAVVHGSHYRAAAELACPGPVATLRLAFTADDLPPPRRIGKDLILATIGHIIDNKRADEVIRAIAASRRLRDHVLYLLVGPVKPDEKARLIALARTLGVREPHFTGWVPDEVLCMIAAGTDVMCCLRYPTLEGASASMITAMLSGRPTLVSNHASYAEVPEGLVLKCRPGDEAADVMRHLEAIIDAPEVAREIGQRAREYARKAFSPASYAAELLQLLEAAITTDPAIRTARRVGQRLAEIGVKLDDPAVARMDCLLTGLLHGRRTADERKDWRPVDAKLSTGDAAGLSAGLVGK